MGGFARVALPVAAAVAAPHAAGFLGTAGGVTGGAGLLASEAAVPGVTTFLSGAQLPASAALVPTVSPLAVARAGISGLLDLNSQRQAAAQAAFARVRGQAEMARLRREFQIRERDRRNRLRRAVAAERARFGAAGILSTGGSADAIIRGLRSQAEEGIRLDRERVNFRRRSLLEESRPQRRSGFTTLTNSLSPFINLFD